MPGGPNIGILITGAPGTLAMYLLRELILSNKAKNTTYIFCLLRTCDGSDITAETRLSHKWEELFKSSLSEFVKNSSFITITAISGDVSQSMLGLQDPATYKQIVSRVRIIFHCAADVHMFRNYAAMKISNVRGARNIIQFALESNPRKKINYISTAAVCEDYNSPLRASPLHGNGPYSREGYSQSKWVAENLVWKASQAFNLNVSIFRCGFIYGGQTGVNMNTKKTGGTTAVTHIMSIIYRLCFRLNSYPVEMLDPLVIKEGHAVKHIATVGVSTTDEYGTFHHLGGKLHGVIEILRNKFALRGIPFKDWFALLLKKFDEDPEDMDIFLGKEWFSRIRQYVKDSGQDALFHFKLELEKTPVIGGIEDEIGPNYDAEEYLISVTR
ncbi:carboxylic acid reductase-like [Folsomia candida]|uniref:Polyketide synthase HetM n=1 Tax=Folsomia candida TaxID=158441 RepID=A0A226DXG3_FOLCA|nr:carboxylic acid reductase-like [Folsomia candida]OXA49750.1 Polyketide synthase HetM [Folsomia candida]